MSRVGVVLSSPAAGATRHIQSARSGSVFSPFWLFGGGVRQANKAVIWPGMVAALAPKGAVVAAEGASWLRGDAAASCHWPPVYAVARPACTHHVEQWSRDRRTMRASILIGLAGPHLGHTGHGKAWEAAGGGVRRRDRRPVSPPPEDYRVVVASPSTPRLAVTTSGCWLDSNIVSVRCRRVRPHIRSFRVFSSLFAHTVTGANTSPPQLGWMDVAANNQRNTGASDNSSKSKQNKLTPIPSSLHTVL